MGITSCYLKIIIDDDSDARETLRTRVIRLQIGVISLSLSLFNISRYREGERDISNVHIYAVVYMCLSHSKAVCKVAMRRDLFVYRKTKKLALQANRDR